MRHSVPEPHWEPEVQRSRHAPSTQSWLVLQWLAFEQVPAGRGLHRPPWHELPVVQSVSAVQPAKQVLFTHQPPWPQSALYVQDEGTPASGVVPVPPPVEPLPPPVLPEPPPVAPLPPPVEPVPPPVPVPPSGCVGAAPQKPAWQVWPVLQSRFFEQGRTQ
jgi:hypothetical protein